MEAVRAEQVAGAVEAVYDQIYQNDHKNHWQMKVDEAEVVWMIVVAHIFWTPQHDVPDHERVEDHLQPHRFHSYQNWKKLNFIAWFYFIA